MAETDLTELCTRVSSLMDEVDEQSDLGTFLESVEDMDQVLVGASVARGHLTGAVKISQKTLPLIVAAEAALSDFVDNLDEDEDEDDEEDEEDEDDDE
jgi:hypothetical protein